MNRRSHEDALRGRWLLEGAIPLAGVAAGSSWHRARSADGTSAALLLVEGENALEAADAGRRAVLVQDDRLLEVRDVQVIGEDDPEGPLTVVVYPLPPAAPLAALLARGPMRPETARSVIGEAASALEVARRRGIRHQYLDSNRIFVDPEGDRVWVLGTGVEAATHGRQDRPGAEAAARDVTALVALLYRALTGRSPKRGADGEVPRPSSVTERRIPADLDSLCDLVLNHRTEEAPRTTRELLEELGPWQAIPVTLEAYDPEAETVLRPASGKDDREPSVGTSAPAAAAAAVPVADAAMAGAPTTDAATAGDDAVPGDDAVARDDLADTIVRPLPPVGEEPVAAGGAETAGEDPSSSTDPGEAATSEDSVTTDESPEDPTAPEDSAVAEPAPTEDASAVMDDPSVVDDQDTVLRMPPVREDAPDDRETVVRMAPVPGASDEVDTPGAPAAAAPEDSAPPAESPAETPEERRGFVERLRLTQTRTAAAFPAAMSIERPSADPFGDRSQPAAETSPAVEPSAAASGSLAPLAGDGSPSLPAAAADPHATPATSTAHDPDADRAAREHVETAAGAPVVRSSADADRPEREAELTQRLSSPVPGESEDASGPIIVPGRARSYAAEPQAAPAAPSAGTMWRDVVGVAFDSDQAQGAQPPAEQKEQRSRQAPWILVGFAILLIVALVVAITTATAGLRDRLADPLGTADATSAAAPASSAPAEAAPQDPSAAPAEPAPAAQPPQIANVSLIGAQGVDHEEQLGRVTDGDPATAWHTKNYRSAQYGNYKDGMGLKIDLAAPATVTAVTVTTPAGQGGAIELHTADADGNLGELVATATFTGQGEIRLAPAAPLEGVGSLIVWIPNLPQDGSAFRAQISEIRVE